MALHVTDTSKTIFQHTRADGRVEEVEGYLGTGYDATRPRRTTRPDTSRR